MVEPIRIGIHGAKVSLLALNCCDSKLNEDLIKTLRKHKLSWELLLLASMSFLILGWSTGFTQCGMGMGNIRFRVFKEIKSSLSRGDKWVRSNQKTVGAF